MNIPQKRLAISTAKAFINSDLNSAIRALNEGSFETMEEKLQVVLNDIIHLNMNIIGHDDTELYIKEELEYHLVNKE